MPFRKWTEVHCAVGEGWWETELVAFWRFPCLAFGVASRKDSSGRIRVVEFEWYRRSSTIGSEAGLDVLVGWWPGGWGGLV